MTTPSRVRPQPDTTTSEHEGGRARVARIVLGKVFAADSANYFLLLGTTLFLVVFGLVMVLSSSSVTSYISDDDSFGGFAKQATFAAIGVPVMLFVARLPLRFWKRIAWPALLAACVLQALVVFTPLGYAIGGNQNWLKIGSITAQPSEAIKLALVVWLGVVLLKKKPLLADWKHALIPVLPIGGGAIGLVMVGGDLGTVAIMAGILVGALFFAGVRMRVLLGLAVVGAIGAGLAAIASPNRVQRILSFLDTECADYTNLCWQPMHATWAMGSGGIFGVGLGNSKAKWSWLPAADNDYIFAIIGEELGLIGAIVVLLLFIVLAIAFIRIIHASADPFVKVTTGAVMVWLVGQGLVNIGVVIGVLPVLGVPLPFISSGGTALLTSLVAVGVVLSFARHQHNTPLFGRTKKDEGDESGGARHDVVPHDDARPAGVPHDGARPARAMTAADGSRSARAMTAADGSRSAQAMTAAAADRQRARARR